MEQEVFQMERERSRGVESGSKSKGSSDHRTVIEVEEGILEAGQRMRITAALGGDMEELVVVNYLFVGQCRELEERGEQDDAYSNEPKETIYGERLVHVRLCHGFEGVLDCR